MNRKELLVSIFLAVGFLILFEQYLNHGVWFELEDIHHETFAIASVSLVIGILIGTVSSKIEG